MRLVYSSILDDQIAEVVRRQHRVAVARVDARWFNVLHDAHNSNLVAVANGVGFAFHGAVQEVVQQDFVVRHVAQNVDHVVPNLPR